LHVPGTIVPTGDVGFVVGFIDVGVPGPTVGFTLGFGPNVGVVHPLIHCPLAQYAHGPGHSLSCLHGPTVGFTVGFAVGFAVGIFVGVKLGTLVGEIPPPLQVQSVPA